VRAVTIAAVMNYQYSGLWLAGEFFIIMKSH